MIIDSSKVDCRFLFYQLLLSRPQLKRLATGAAQQNLSGQLVKSYKLPFPPLREQQAIACILGALDDKIELNRLRNRTLEAMARAIFQSWLIDFDPVYAKSSGITPADPKPELSALFPDSFDDSPTVRSLQVGGLGWCVNSAQKWKTVELPRGRFQSIGRLQRCRGSRQVRFAKSLLLRQRTLSPGTVLQIAVRRYGRHSQLVVSLYGATAGIATMLGIELCANQACCGLIPNEHSCCFVHQTLYGSLAQLQQQARGSAQQNLSQSIVADFRCVIPDGALLAHFEKTVRPLYRRCVESHKESLTLAALRDTLLPKLISGELRVSDAERVIGRVL